LNPHFKKNIEVEWASVLIKTGLIIDVSASSLIKLIAIPEFLVAGIVARTIHSVGFRQIYPLRGWRWSFEDKSTNDNYRYMEILAETQQTVETADWQKVQHNNI
jgi:hypothetical protein